MINNIQILIMPVSINTSDALLIERHNQDIAEARTTLQEALNADYTIEQALPFVTGDNAFVWMLLVCEDILRSWPVNTYDTRPTNPPTNTITIQPPITIIGD